MKSKKKTDQKGNKELNSILQKGTTGPMPKSIEPMLASLVSTPPDEEGWLYEMKWDGFRAIAYINGDEINLCSRNNKSFNDKFYPLYESLKEWKINAVLDGEIIVVNEEGIPDFSNLQLWRSEADGQVLYYFFDILWLDGVSMVDLPIEERRAVLSYIIPSDHPHFRMSQVMKDSGNEAFEQARSLHLEGVMAKKAGSAYTIGKRTKDWLKIKTEKTQELVIGGYTKNEGTNKLFSALLLGIMEGKAFRFVTPVGTGFNRKMQEDILKKVKTF